MAASATAIAPAHSGPFANVLTPHAAISSQTAASNLVPLASAAAQSLYQRSVSPRSPRNMSPRASPQPRQEDRLALPAQGGGSPAPINAATKISTPLAAITKSIQNGENGTSATVATTSPSSSSNYVSEATTATTTTAPAVAPPPSSADNVAGINGPSSTSRPVVDPGLAVTSEATPNRSFTFPPPLSDDLQTPNNARNMSLPNNVFASGSPKPGSGSSSKRHKCQFCGTEFTRHHNLKSHLLTHSHEKPYECPQCQSRFRRLHDLKRHTKLHTGERPHVCVNCGRKFARGDALARHSKGPGGCAGRRPSFIDDDPTRHHDDSMDGIEYTAEPDHMDEDEDVLERGATDPTRRGNLRQDTYRPNTYPGVVPPGGLPSVYPPVSRSRDPSISSQGPGPLTGIQHLGQQVFPQGGMTESPKPISPGQSVDRSLPPGNRMPSQFSGPRGTSPLSLPPPAPQQLPGMQNFPPPPPPGSHPGSMSSSHHSGSGNSTREILGAAGDVWNIIRDLEKRLNDSRLERDAMIAQLRADHERAAAEHRAQIHGLELEVDRLKAQLNDRVRTPAPTQAS